MSYIKFVGLRPTDKIGDGRRRERPADVPETSETALKSRFKETEAGTYGREKVLEVLKSSKSGLTLTQLKAQANINEHWMAAEIIEKLLADGKIRNIKNKFILEQ